jgi:F-type H+-transporting ATPase subunit delta
MRGTSETSLRAAERRFEPMLRSAGAEAVTLGEQLFALVDILDGSGSLRRAMSDPSADPEAKARLAGQILAEAEPQVREIATVLARSRWSTDRDLGEAAELLGFDAILAAAEYDGTLQQVQEELFRISKALAGQRELRRALVDLRATPVARIALVDALIDGRTQAATGLLARRAAHTPRGRSYVVTLVHLGELAAKRRNRLVASVTTAAELSPAQRERLTHMLQRAYDTTLQLNVTVDPEVIGGFRIQVGPDVVDSTVLARLVDVRRTLAS